MLALNLPPFQPKIELREGKRFIFDILRRQYVALTPEEWVRQHFVHLLIDHKGYPGALMANEVLLRLNTTKKRCDTVVYDRSLAPRMILEYKAPHVNITQDVFNQVGRYNLVLRVDYLVVSNGLKHYCCKMDYERQTCDFLPDIPHYTRL